MKKSILFIFMAALCLKFQAKAQTIYSIRGQIKNAADRQPLPGTSVKTKSGTAITQTDLNGKFSVNTPDSTGTLLISFTGYKSQALAYHYKKTIQINLEPEDNELQEIQINAGYYTVKDKERTGSISRVTAKTIGQQPISNPLQALQGRLPGVQIQQTSGFAGSSFNISIRGRNSLRNEGNAPLYLIDGVPIPSTSIGSVAGGNITGGGDPLSSLNPNDIASIEVLKDADATAIYGSRGANGVVLISTKTGKSGQTNIDLHAYHGIAKVPHFMKLLNTPQYLEMRNEAFKNDQQDQAATDYDLNGTWDKDRYTDWQKTLIGGTAKTTDLQLGLSGGNENTHFLLSGTKHRESTVLPGDFADHKYSALFNLSHRSPNQKFNATLSLSYLIDNNNLIQYDPTSVALTLAPNSPAGYDQDGKLNWQNGTWDNPFARLKTRYSAKTNTLIANTQLSYQLIESLQLKTSLGYTNTILDERTGTPSEFYNPNFGITTGDALFADSKLNTWIVEPQLEYRKNLGKGKLTVLLGSTFQQNHLQAQTLSASGYTSDLMLSNLKAATQVDVTALSQTLYKYQAIFARLNYDYAGKYLLNLTGRRDGSSRFGPGKQFANFGAVGAAWLFSEENWLKTNFPALSSGKLRASYGITGSDQIGDYGYYDIWNNTNYHYAGSSGLYPTSLFNPDYAWEKNRKLETAVELSFLNQRVNTSFAYYQNRSGNQLIGFPLSGITGFSDLLSNMNAVVENSGFEFTLSTINLQNKTFSWSTDLNFSLPKNKLLSFPGIENTAYALTREVGKSIYIQRAFKYLGVAPNTGRYEFEDLNNDGSYNPSDDYQSLVANRQQYYGGLQNNFKFKNLELSVFFQFAKQTGNSYLQNFVTPGFIGNQPIAVLQRWQSDGEHQNVQRFTQTPGEEYIAYEYYLKNSDHKITDASYIRLKNVSLSYTLPGVFQEKLKLKNARIYLQGQNLFTITKYIGLDPETQSASLPPLRTLTMGIQLTF